MERKLTTVEIENASRGLGLKLIGEEGSIFVKEVIEGSCCAEKNIKPGDRIMSVNLIDFTKISCQRFVYVVIYILIKVSIWQYFEIYVLNLT